MKKIAVAGHENCIEMVSGDFRIAVTTEVGPRVIGGFVGGSDNIFRVLPQVDMKGVGTGFRLYGGHRLWHSPEAAPRSYAPDNVPVHVYEMEEGGILFENDPEALTGIQKSIHINPLGNGLFRLTHRLRNCGHWTVSLAPWALSVMAPGGMAVIPQMRDPDGYPYAPDRQLVLWAYSSYADPRILYGDNYLGLKQDAQAEAPCKIGFNADDGWIGYVNNGTALIKYFEVYDGDDIDYPDNGCNVESYTCKDFCEIETVGPLYDLEPDAECEHVEVWQGLGGLPEIRTLNDVETALEPLLLSEEESACCCGCDDDDDDDCGDHDCECHCHGK